MYVNLINFNETIFGKVNPTIVIICSKYSGENLVSRVNICQFKLQNSDNRRGWKRKQIQ